MEDDLELQFNLFPDKQVQFPKFVQKTLKAAFYELITNLKAILKIVVVRGALDMQEFLIGSQAKLHFYFQLLTESNKKFCNIFVHPSLWHVYPVTKAVQAVVDPCYVWDNRGSWCTNTLCKASLRVWFESHREKRMTLSNSRT